MRRSPDDFYEENSGAYHNDSLEWLCPIYGGDGRGASLFQSLRNYWEQFDRGLNNGDDVYTHYEDYEAANRR